MFRLSKWYLDCVADDGDVAILYWARLEWGAAHLHFGSVLRHPPDGSMCQRTTLRPDAGPTAVDPDEIRWACPRLRARGVWRRRTSSVARTLHDGPNGAIHWHCVMPRASTQIEVGDHTVTGLGYAEHLTVTLPPWRLPIDVLRWGRYLAPDDDAVWMRWDGPSTRSWAFRRGIEQPTPTITDVAVDMPSARVTISDDRELRSGRVAETALRPLRLFVSLIPRWRAATETKWLARGMLSGPGVASTGWVIHEVVTWR